MEDLNDELMTAVKAASKIISAGGGGGAGGGGSGGGGKKAEVPAPQADVQSAMKKAVKATGDVNKARNDMLNGIQTYKNSLDKLRNDLIGFRHKLPKEKFGLDESKPDDKKKIVAARKTLDDGLQEVLDELIESETKVGDLDDVLEQEIK